tara:strand:- start:1700 stop:1900 length:201 start_codon:yes stop_codon:yes gene_type:complete
MDRKIKNNNCILQDVLSQVKSIKTDVDEIKKDLSIIKNKLENKDIEDEIFTTDETKPNESSGWFFS